MTILALDKLFNLLKEELIKYQRIYSSDYDLEDRFEFKVEPAYNKYQSIDQIITNLKSFVEPSSLCSLSFLIRDRIRDRDLFGIYQSKESWSGWVLKNLMEGAG